MARIFHGFTPNPTANKQAEGPKEAKQATPKSKPKDAETRSANEGGGQ